MQITHTTFSQYQVQVFHFRVIGSKHSGYPVGTIVTGALGWSTHVKIDPETSNIKDPFFLNVPEGVPPSRAVGALGLTG